MTSPRRQVVGVILRALLLLMPLLALWYFSAAAVAWVPAKLARPVVAAFTAEAGPPRLVGRHVVYPLVVEAPYRPGVASPRAEAQVEVPAANYTFGLAIFLALALAARASHRARGIAIGVAILVVLPALGIAADALRQLGASPQLAPFVRWGGGTREAIALLYQVSSLLLPTLVPIALWLGLFPQAWRPIRREPSAADGLG